MDHKHTFNKKSITTSFILKPCGPKPVLQRVKPNKGQLKSPRSPFRVSLIFDKLHVKYGHKRNGRFLAKRCRSDFSEPAVNTRSKRKKRELERGKQEDLRRYHPGGAHSNMNGGPTTNPSLYRQGAVRQSSASSLRLNRGAQVIRPGHRANGLSVDRTAVNGHTTLEQGARTPSTSSSSSSSHKSSASPQLNLSTQRLHLTIPRSSVSAPCSPNQSWQQQRVVTQNSLTPPVPLRKRTSSNLPSMEPPPSPIVPGLGTLLTSQTLLGQQTNSCPQMGTLSLVSSCMQQNGSQSSTQLHQRKPQTPQAQPQLRSQSPHTPQTQLAQTPPQGCPQMSSRQQVGPNQDANVRTDSGRSCVAVWSPSLAPAKQSQHQRSLQTLPVPTLPLPNQVGSSTLTSNLVAGKPVPVLQAPPRTHQPLQVQSVTKLQLHLPQPQQPSVQLSTQSAMNGGQQLTPLGSATLTQSRSFSPNPFLRLTQPRQALQTTSPPIKSLQTQFVSAVPATIPTISSVGPCSSPQQFSIPQSQVYPTPPQLSASQPQPSQTRSQPSIPRVQGPVPLQNGTQFETHSPLGEFLDSSSVVNHLQPNSTQHSQSSPSSQAYLSQTQMLPASISQSTLKQTHFQALPSPQLPQFPVVNARHISQPTQMLK